jgi:uncharacterized membrane protein
MFVPWHLYTQKAPQKYKSLSKQQNFYDKYLSLTAIGREFLNH